METILLIALNFRPNNVICADTREIMKLSNFFSCWYGLMGNDLILVFAKFRDEGLPQLTLYGFEPRLHQNLFGQLVLFLLLPIILLYQLFILIIEFELLVYWI